MLWTNADLGVTTKKRLQTITYFLRTSTVRIILSLVCVSTLALSNFTSGETKLPRPNLFYVVD